MSCQISEKCFDCENIDYCDEHRKWPQCNDWERLKKQRLENEEEVE